MSRPEDSSTTAPQPAGEIRRMFADIHPTYDFLNRFLSGGRDRAWRRRTCREVAAQPGERVLDVCCGTADLTLEFAGHEGLVVGSDFTPEMVERGVAKARRASAPVRLLVADTTALPFADATFDVVTVAFGIRNVPDLDRGLREMARVTCPGGRVAILEFSSSPRAFSRFLHRAYNGTVLPLVGRLVSGHPTAYSYLPASIDSFPDRNELARRMQDAGLEQVTITPMNFDLVTLHIGRRGS